MKKNIVYFTVFLALAVLTYFVVFKNDDNSFSSTEANFTLKDTASISTIFLSSMKGENIKLTRTENGWTLNDSFVPKKEAIQFLLETMHDQKPSNPVDINVHDEAIKELSTNSTKVEIYEGSKKTHTFYVGKDPAANNLTYMLQEGAKRPYIVKFPMQNTFLGVRYMTRLADWRSTRLFFDNSPVEEIIVDFKDSTQYNFSVKNQTNASVIVSKPFATPLNQKRANSYVSFFENLYCYGYEDSYIYKDSIILKGLQLGTINLKRINKKLETLTIFFKPKVQDSKSTISYNGIEYDGDIFYGLLNKKDFIVIDKSAIEKMFRKSSEFFEADELKK